MSTITQISLWKDTGFTEGCLEVPKKGSSLPTPDFTYTGNYVPSTADIFIKLKLRVPYTTLMDCSYIAITLDMNNGEDKTFYGWIDNVSIISDTVSSALTQVDWHVDLWRTYISNAIIGSGMVRRRPLLTGDSVPPQPYPFRYRTFASFTSVTTSYNEGYIYILTNESSATEDNTVISTTFCCPVYLYLPDDEYNGCPSLNSFIKGNWDEQLGLIPENIKGVFYSPIPPTPNMSGWTIGHRVMADKTPAPKACYSPNSVSSAFSEFTIEYPEPMMTDDVTIYYVTGFDGEIVGALPWGTPVSNLKYRTILDSNGGYIQVRTDINGHVNGTCFTIPLISLEVTQNGWSTYNYSGQRQADITQRQIEAEKARESALVGMASNVTSSVASSAMLGSLGGPVGTLGGALIGGVSSIISGTIGAAADYAVTTKYNDMFQGLNDYRAAHQTNGLLMSGTGFDHIRFGNNEINIVKVVTDEYSQEQRTNDISLYGAHVSEPRESCQSLVDAGGPLQITNVVVRGAIPVQAKEYIRGRLSNGVRMI